MRIYTLPQKPLHLFLPEICEGHNLPVGRGAHWVGFFNRQCCTQKFHPKSTYNFRRSEDGIYIIICLNLHLISLSIYMANPHHNYPSQPHFQECWAALRAEWSSNCLETQWWWKVCAIFIGVELFLLLGVLPFLPIKKISWKQRFFWVCGFCQSKNLLKICWTWEFSPLSRRNIMFWTRNFPMTQMASSAAVSFRASILALPGWIHKGRYRNLNRSLFSVADIIKIFPLEHVG